tara:strand:+ start:3236 stop:3829 length:594 start_codon:yes stop_codon:yes gene_type:complete
MSSLNSLSNGYKGGSKSSPAPKLTPPLRDHIQDILIPVETHYRENSLTGNDMMFLKENIQCLKNGITFQNSGTFNPSVIAKRIAILLMSNYESKRLSPSDLNLLINGFVKINLNVEQNEKKITKETKPNTKTKITTISNYGGGSSEIRSENPRQQIPKNPQKIQIDDLISKIRMWYADKNLSEDDINVIMKELIKIK